MLGFASFFIFLLVKKAFGEKIIKIVFPTFVCLALIAVCLVIWLVPELHLYGGVYQLMLWQKIAITSALIVLSAILLVFIIIYAKKNQQVNVYKIAFSLLLIETTVMVIFGTLMKGLAFGFATYPMILLCQIIVLFVNIPLNTVLITLLTNIIKKKNIDCPII